MKLRFFFWVCFFFFCITCLKMKMSVSIAEEIEEFEEEIVEGG
jgi:hypothetical protein